MCGPHGTCLQMVDLLGRILPPQRGSQSRAEWSWLLAVSTLFDILTDQQKQAVSAVLANAVNVLQHTNASLGAIDAVVLAIPPSQVGAILARLSESADKIKAASEKLDKAADNILSFTQRFK